MEQTEDKKIEVQDFERFDIKTETKLLKALKKLFVEETCLVPEETIRNMENVMVVDQANVCMCIAKTSKAKLILRRFYNTDCTHKEPVLTFRDSRNNIEAGSSAYSLDYFLNILKVIKEVSDHFHIKIGSDSPSIIETEDFRFLLAPRIESE